MGSAFWKHLSHEPRGAIAVPFTRHALSLSSGVHEVLCDGHQEGLGSLDSYSIRSGRTGGSNG